MMRSWRSVSAQRHALPALGVGGVDWILTCVALPYQEKGRGRPFARTAGPSLRDLYALAILLNECHRSRDRGVRRLQAIQIRSRGQF